MLGQLKWSPGRWDRGEEGLVYGLPVFRITGDPEARFRVFRLRRAGKSFRRSGITRVLTPEGFRDWPLLAPLEPVSPEPLVRFKADALALAALRRRDLSPERSTVALRGIRVDRDIERAAVRLCPGVRRLIISAPNGGAELSRYLRQEFGVPILPPEERGDLTLSFSPRLSAPEGGLTLFGQTPGLDGLTLCAPDLLEEDRRSLPLLSALWQGGCIRAEAVKIVGIP